METALCANDAEPSFPETLARFDNCVTLDAKMIGRRLLDLLISLSIAQALARTGQFSPARTHKLDKARERDLNSICV